MLLKWFDKISHSCGMEVQDDNPYKCGIYCQGNGQTVDGFAWIYSYSDFFSVVKCDIVFTKDVCLSANENVQYLGLRLDYAQHLPPGKVTAFLEKDGITFDTTIKRGTHLAYTEVTYTPEFYRKHFQEVFTSPLADPIEIIQNMGADHHWSANVTKILIEIDKCTLSGHAAELYYVAKATELMSALIEMKTTRRPHNTTDYEDIMRVIHYIDENFHGEIRQSDLIKMSTMGSTKLKTVFKNFTGCSITDYILEKKTDYAAHLLTSTDMSVEEIAFSLGFTTVSGFSTSFRKRCGVSPSNYRKQLRFLSTDTQTWADTLNSRPNDIET